MTAPKKRTYDHYCSLAKALDVIGDRWAPLIVRDLLLGPRRFTDLQNGLPGIASDMLTTRLRQLVEAGIVEKVELDAPAAGTAYALTELGGALEGPLTGLARWGLELMPPPSDADAFTPSIMAGSMRVLLRPGPADELTVQFRSLGEAYTVEIAGGEARPRQGTHPSPDLTIEGPPGPVMALIVGGLDPGEATSDEWDTSDVQVEGSRTALERVRAMVSVPDELRTPM